jgi:hypothetical protein
MNTSTRLCIDLSHLPESTRKRVPDFGAVTASPDGTKSADATGVTLTTNATTYATQWKKSPGGPLASSLTVGLKLPGAIMKDHFAYGTSVFATGQAGLELARIELARAGLPKIELDCLRTEHVSLQNVAIPYMLDFASDAETTLHMKGMVRYARLLGLDTRYSRVPDSEFKPVEFRERRDATESGAHAAEGGQAQVSEEVVLIVESNRFAKQVRINVCLDAAYLQRQGWDKLESWRSAQAENRYETIFNMTVRHLFRCDGKQEGLKNPSQDVYDMLSSPREEKLLREYVAGRDPMSFGDFPFVLRAESSNAAKKTAVKKYRASILAETGIDINIPWLKFRHIQPIPLLQKLRYPGDFHPETASMPECFCEENWPQLLGKLRQAYSDV